LRFTAEGCGGRPSDKPDRLHFHQLVMRVLEISLVGRRYRALANPLATAFIVTMAAAPMLAGVVLSDSNAGARGAVRREGRGW
jgi:UDP-GlcNAc:undecaprenyl-phosphate/decaprenyl-phosphate GlcNAc-1-phosphate transferase